ncbi:hypothetical protein [Methanochimaera problematica]|nr:hypothetical protein [Methanoplanus sp. FWC-SCC4]
MFFIGAIAIVMILAFVVKPIISGESVSILPESKTKPVVNIPLPEGATTKPYSPVSSSVIATPTPVWDGAAKEVQFVDPSTYNLQWEGTVKDYGSRTPGYEKPDENKMVVYASINGQWDATTQIINIPFPYWETEVSFESMGDVGSTDITITENEGGTVEGIVASEAESLGVAAESQFYIIPSINIQVVNADQPNGLIYILNSLTEGPLPKEIQKEEASASEEFFRSEDVLAEEQTTIEGEVIKRENLNEYLWKHKYYEGSGNYYFIIHPNMLKSYKIDILVPEKFIQTQ